MRAVRPLAAFTALFLLATPIVAQDSGGFFSNLFGGDDEAEEDGGGFLERQLEDALSSEGTDVTIRGFEGVLSGEATVETITISDADGIWLRLENVVLDWNRGALLRRRLEVTELSAALVELPRRPLPADTVDVPSAEAKPFSLPSLPVSVQIDKLAIERMELGETVLGVETTASVDGSMSLADGEGEVDIALLRLDGEGSLNLDASYSNTSEVLAVDLALTEAEDGILAALIDLPGRPSVDLTVQGEAPIDDFSADIRLATNGVERLGGTIATRQTEGGARITQVRLAGDPAPIFSDDYQAFFGTDVRIGADVITSETGTLIENLAIDAAALDLYGLIEIGTDGLPRRIDLDGEISAGGQPVLLPISGPETRVGQVSLSMQFDASTSEEWNAEVAVIDLERPGFAAEEINLDGSGRIARDPRAVTAGFDFAARALDLGSAEAKEALGEEVTGRAEIAWTQGDPLRISNLVLDGETYGLEGRAEIAFGEGGPDIDGTARVRADRLSAFSGLAGRALGGSAELQTRFSARPLGGFFDVSATGRTTDLVVSEPRADAILAGQVSLDLSAARDENGTRLEIRRLDSPNASLRAQAALKSEGSSASVSGSIEDASIILPDVDGPFRITAEASETDGLWTWRADAGLDGTSLNAEGTAVALLTEPIIAASGNFVAEDLSDFATLAGRPIAGSINTRFAGEAAVNLSRISIDLDGTATDIVTGIPQADPLLLGDVVLDVDAAWSRGVLSLTQTVIEGPEFRVAADGILTRTAGSMALQARVNDATKVLQNAPTGQIDIDAVLGRDGRDWNFDVTSAGPSFSVDAEGTALDPTGAFQVEGRIRASAQDLSDFSRLAERELAGSIDLSAEGRLSRDLSDFDITASGAANRVALGMAEIDPILDGNVAFDLRAERVNNSDIRYDIDASGPGYTIDSAGTVADPLTAPLWQGRLALDATDLADFSGLARRPLAGSVSVDAEGMAAADLSEIDLDLRASTRDLSVGLAGLDDILSGEITLTAQADRDLQGPLAYVVSANGTSFAISSEGEVTSLEGTPEIDGQIDARLDDLSILSDLANRPLSGSVALQASGSAVSDLSAFDVTADLNGSGLSAGLGAADALIRGDVVARLDAEGSIEAIRLNELLYRSDLLTVTGSGTAGADGENIDLTARLSDLSPLVPGFSGPATADGTIGRRADGTLAIDIDATGPGGINASIAGTAAADVSTVDLDITGSAPLGLANQFIQPRSLLGTARFDLGLNGRPSPENLSGTIVTDAARLVAPSLGFVFENIETRIGLAGGAANITMDASIPGGGGLSVRGPLALTAPFNADLTIQLQNAYISNPRLYETTVNGPIRIQGPLTGGAQIRGDLSLGETLVRIPSSGLGGAGDVPQVLHLNATPPIRATLRRADALGGEETSGNGGGGAAYGLNVTLSAPNQVFVRGRGLDSEFGGQLTLSGTTRDIVPVGNFGLIRGRLDILGQRLAIEEATATMQGSFVPVVRIRATTDTDEYRISVIVSGPVSDPEITFTSEPDLPEEEVLSRLLFGRGLDTLSPIQAARLALAVRTLAGRGGEGLVGEIRDTAGLADFDVTQDEDGELAVRAGAYLSENIYTDVTVGASGETEINLNLDVSKTVTVKGTVTSEGETSVGVFYERDY